ncbi:MAG: flagellar basal-body MS-ring/collar protein FliF [Gammaproteobacteria bacterium]|jgi:flagellar M-ring protein FliF|nr:flagellar basal-body MS-ring/collar protein FliF [Gammaproteobacteria bacterium]
MAEQAAGGNLLVNLANVPGGRQMALLIGLSMSIAIGVTAAFWMREPSYELLYSNLSERDTGAIMDALRADDVPYRLDNGALLVPSKDVYATRLRMSSQGLPRGAGFGLEMIEGQSDFSTSQFMENARYHHALETELARTISNLQPVQSARVHLALPKPSVFVRKSNKPSASVLLDLYPGRNLEETQVASIVHLVASSIPELESSHVTVVDQRGRLLNSPGSSDAAALSSREFEYVQRVQDTYAERIVNLLTPMMGPDRVRATVNADIDFTVREETREVYDPEATVIRSEQLSQDTQRDGSNAAGVSRGVPGALSNQPPADTGTGTGEDPAEEPPLRVSTQSTRNFEIDRSMSHVKEAANSITRISVAVLVDNLTELDEDGEVTRRQLTAEELAEITSLVKGAVGFNEARGDSVSITNVSFYESPELPEPEGPGFMAQPLVRDILRQLPAAALLFVIAFGIVRPVVLLLSRGMAGGTAAALPSQGSGAGAPAAAMPATLSFDDKVNVAKQLASNDPERVAQVVRAWVQEGK